MSKNNATSSKPLIIFVGVGFDGLEHMSARLQQFGVDTAWIGYPYEPRRVVRARMFTNHAASAKNPVGLARIIRGLGPERVVDIICGEDSLADVSAAARQVELPSAMLAELDRRTRCSDKFWVSEQLREHGVSVPPALDGDVVSAEQAAAELGLPIVVKSRLGYAGRGVRIVDTVAEAEAALQELRDWSGGGVFFEQLIPGTAASWGAAYADGEVLMEGAYHALRFANNELGAPDGVETVVSRQMSEGGKRSIEVLGGRGLINIDFMRGDDGRAYAIDVNMRPWHSTVAFLEVGLDFVQAYLATLGLGPRPAARSCPDGEQFGIFPRSDADRLGTEPVTALRGLARGTRRYLGWTNPGYIVASGFRVIGIVGANAAENVRRRMAARRDR